MISFKDFLNEKAMNMKTYSRLKTVADNSARVGCEFEMLIPEDSAMYYSEHEGAPSVDIDSIDYHALDDFFDLSRSDRRQLENAYEEWVTKKKEEYVDDNWQNFYDPDDEDKDEDYAKRKAMEEAEGSFGIDTEYSDWIEDEFGRNKMHKLVDYFDLTPKYGFTPDGREVYTEDPSESDDTSKTHSNVMDHILELVNRTTDDEDYNDWIATEDGSIEGGGHGIEVISPPQPVNIAIDNITSMFSFMDKYAETNESTGFHINVSVPNIKEVNKVKLIMFLGEKYVLDIFGRADNTFTKSQIDKISTLLRAGDTIPQNVKDIEDLFEKALSQAKYSSVNFTKLKSGYLEFRIAGGKNYHKKLKEVKDAVYRYVTALEIACDPKAEVKEYYKKLYSLTTSFFKIDSSNKALADRVLQSEESKIFSRIVSYAPYLYTDITRQVNPLGGHRSIDLVAATLVGILAVLQKFKLTLTAKEALAIRKYFFKPYGKDGWSQIFNAPGKINRMESGAGIKITNPDLINFVRRELKNVGIDA